MLPSFGTLVNKTLVVFRGKWTMTRVIDVLAFSNILIIRGRLSRDVHVSTKLTADKYLSLTRWQMMESLGWANQRRKCVMFAIFYYRHEMTRACLLRSEEYSKSIRRFHLIGRSITLSAVQRGKQTSHLLKAKDRVTHHVSIGVTVSSRESIEYFSYSVSLIVFFSIFLNITVWDEYEGEEKSSR